MISETFKIDGSPALVALKAIDAQLLRVAAAVSIARGAFSGFSSAVDAFAVQGQKIKETLDLGGELSDVKAATGETAGNVLLLRQMFANAGLAANGVTANINKFQKALSGLDDEGKSTTKALEELGLTGGQLDGMLPLEQMQELARRFQAIVDPNERARIAMDLFGRSGGKMLAMLGDMSALSTARAQVGGLGAVMDAEAGRFDAASDAINASGLKVQQFYAGFASELAPQLEAATDAINGVDLTGLGQSAGASAAAVAALVQAAMPLAPLLVGISAGALGVNTTVGGWQGVFSAAGAVGTSTMARLNAAVQAYNVTVLLGGTRTAGFGAGLQAAGIKGVGAFAMLGTAARTAGAAIAAAFGPASLIIMGVTYAIQKAFEWFTKLEAQTAATRSAIDQASASFNADVGKAKGISSEGERASFIQEQRGKADEAGANARKALEEGNSDAAAVWEQQRAAILRLIDSVKQMPLAVIDANAAAKTSIEETATAAEDAAKRVADAQKGLEQAKFGQLSATDQKAAVLNGQGVTSTEQLDRVMGSNQAQIDAGTAPDWMVAQQAKMVEARTQLVGIEAKIADEQKRAADEATRDANAAAEKAKRGEDWKRSQAEAQQLADAQASGGDDAAERVRMEQRRNELLREGMEIANLSYADAKAAADATVAAEQRAADAKKAKAKKEEDARLAEENQRKAEEQARKQKQQQDWQKGFGWDMAEEAAKLTGDPKKLQAVQLERRREQYTREGIEQGGLSEAEAKKQADRRVKLEAMTQAMADEGAGGKAAPKARAEALFADSLARVGGGGGAVGGGGQDPILKENERQTGHLRALLTTMNEVRTLIAKGKNPVAVAA